MLEDDDFTLADIFIAPPADPTCSDEDSGDEDEGTVNNLTRRQLQAEAVATVKRGQERFDIDGNDESEPTSTLGETITELSPARFSVVEGNEAGTVTKSNQTSSNEDLSSTSPFVAPRRRRSKTSLDVTYGASSNQTENSPVTSLRRVSKPSVKIRESRTQNDSISAAESPAAQTSSPSSASTAATFQLTVHDSDTPPAAKKKKDDKVDRKWVRKDMPKSAKPTDDILRNTYAESDFTPTALFERFLDDEIIMQLVEETNKYAMQKGKHSFQTTQNEFRLFLAILYNSGYATLPRRRMYWEPTDDVHNAAICNAMTRNRFEELMSYVHVADNENLIPGDKYAKVRPMFNALNKNFLASFPRQKNISIDESMVPYYGRHSLKQYIRGKPIRFGYKVWSANTPVGYCIQLEPYQGAGVTHNLLGLGGSVVVNLVSTLPTDNYVLYFDNFFTSLKLLQHLTTINIHATGTVRANRVENCPITSVDRFKKLARGSEEHRLDAESNIIVARWNDNSVVTMASNCHGVEPIGSVQRWSKTKGTMIDVPQPYLISKYNKNMGGVDRMDQNIGAYRISIRSRKWWWPLFAYLLDVAMQNAWLIYRLTGAMNHHPMDQLEFRRSVCNVYYKKYTIERTAIGRPMGRPKPLNQRAPPEVRMDGNHYIEAISTQRRCAVCGMKVKKQCWKCNVGLHMECFKTFHEER